jgi:glucose-1-phosphate adenylyltransferase
MSASLRLNLLGSFGLFRDDIPVIALNSPRLQSLIAYLALHRDAPQPRQYIAFILWPDSTEAQARTNLRNLIHQLRHALPYSGDIFCSDGNIVQWRSDLCLSLDVNEFELACIKHEFDRAVQVYRGELLPECYDDWIMPERERLQQLYVEALRQIIIRKENTRDYQAAIECAKCLLRTEPLREEAYRDLMRLCALSGDRIGIVRAYHLCTTNLRKELNFEPSAATRNAYEHCLQLSAEKSQAGKTVSASLLDQSIHRFEQLPAEGKGEPSTGAQCLKIGANVISNNSSQMLTVILAGGASNLLSILLEKRAKPALPFGGQYQIIDFSLSNVANSGLQHVAVAMQHQPHSLIKHLGRGEPWDLAHAHSPGLEIWQPYRGRQDQGWYRGTADVLYQNRDFIREAGREFVLILAADHVYKQDYREFLSFHEDHHADLTIATTPIRLEEAPRFGMLSINADRRITDFVEKPANSSSTLASLGVYIFRTPILLSLLEEDARDSTSRHDFGQNIIPRVVEHDRAFAYPFNGYWADLGSIVAYWEANLALLADNPTLNMDDPLWPIYTRVEARPPVRCRPPGVIENSLVSTGCVVEGTVINSVLSPDVCIARGAVVRDSVLMSKTFIENGAWVERCILDEEVRIGKGAQVGVGHDNTANHLEPQNLYAGITLVGMRAHVPAGVIVGLNCRIDPNVASEDFQQPIISSGNTVSIHSQQQ